MIDFTLSEHDKANLENQREQALICRKYARYYDEHEEEFAPDELEEYSSYTPRPLPDPDPEHDSAGGVIGMMVQMVQNYGDYTIRMRRGRGGLGNAALMASG